MSPSVVDIIADAIEVLANSTRFSNSMTRYRASHSSTNVASNNVKISYMIEWTITLLTVLQFYYLLMNLFVTYTFSQNYLTPLLSVEQTQSKAPDSVSQWQDPSFQPLSIHVPLQAVLPATAHVKSRRHLWWVSFSSNGIAKIPHRIFQLLTNQ